MCMYTFDKWPVAGQTIGGTLDVIFKSNSSIREAKISQLSNPHAVAQNNMSNALDYRTAKICVVCV